MNRGQFLTSLVALPAVAKAITIEHSYSCDHLQPYDVVFHKKKRGEFYVVHKINSPFGECYSGNPYNNEPEIFHVKELVQLKTRQNWDYE